MQPHNINKVSPRTIISTPPLRNSTLFNENTPPLNFQPALLSSSLNDDNPLQEVVIRPLPIKYFKHIWPYIKIGIYGGGFSGIVNCIMCVIYYISPKSSQNTIIYNTIYQTIILNMSVSVVLCITGYAAFNIFHKIIQHFEKKVPIRTNSINVNHLNIPIKPSRLLKNIKMYSNAADEINHFLEGLTYSFKLLEGTPEPSDKQHAIELGNICCTFIKDITDSMLMLNNIETGTTILTKTPFEIKSLINPIFQTLKLYAKKKRVQLHYDTDLATCNITYGGYRNLLTEVLLNLLINEIKNSSSGNTIQLLIKKDFGRAFNTQMAIFVIYTSTNSTEQQHHKHGFTLDTNSFIMTSILNAKNPNTVRKFNDHNNFRIYAASKLINKMNETTKFSSPQQSKGTQQISGYNVRWFRVLFEKHYFTTSIAVPTEKEPSESASSSNSRSSSNASMISKHPNTINDSTFLPDPKPTQEIVQEVIQEKEKEKKVEKEVEKEQQPIELQDGIIVSNQLFLPLCKRSHPTSPVDNNQEASSSSTHDKVPVPRAVYS